MQKVVIKKRLYLSFFIIFSLLAVVYKGPIAGRWCTALFSWGTYPFLSLYAFVAHPVKKWLMESRDRVTLNATITQLESTNRQLEAELVKLRAMAVYADETKELCAFKQRYSLDAGVVGQVISIISTEYEQTMLVNAGSHHGIAKNMVALAHNCLLGKVVAVYPWYCKVRLITDARCKVSAVCALTGAVGIYHGCNKSEAALFAHVSHLDIVKEGDVILSTGKGLVFPQGFALGTIAHATVNGLSYDVTVKPLLSLSDLSYCLLISKESCEKH